MSRERLRAADYTREDTEQVKAALLTFAVTLGDLLDEVCIVGGLVPSIICASPVDPSALDDGAHVGTNDLDVALQVSVLDEEHYKEIAARLRAKDFRPDRNKAGNRTRQRWCWRHQDVTVEFLIPPAAGVDPDRRRLQNLEPDLAALIVKPLGLAFAEPLRHTLAGHTLQGDEVERTVRFCGPAAFVALKAFALAMRGKEKDAYDLVHVLRRWPDGIRDVADRMAAHAERDPALVGEVLGLLDREFMSESAQGPRAASRFHDEDLDVERVADAFGAVRDFLTACERRGVRWPEPANAA